MSARPPIPKSDAPANLRQRRRAGGDWRVWWEPTAPMRATGATPVELDADRPTWSVREARRLNTQALARLAPAKPRRRAPRGRTMLDLIEAYKASPKWRLSREDGGLAPDTKRTYAGIFQRIERKWGHRLVIDFDNQIVLEWLETLATEISIDTAQHTRRGLSVLFTYAKRKGWRGDNPCLDIDLPQPRPRQKTASWAELQALLAAADQLGRPGVACAIALGVLQGQRPMDILTAHPSQFLEIEVAPDGAAWAARLDAPTEWIEVTPDAPLHRAIDTARALGLLSDDGGTVGLWTLVRSKRGNQGGFLLHPEVMRRVSDLARAAKPGQDVLIAGDAGQPYTRTAFGNRYRQARTKAAKTHPGLADLQFRDLRRTFGVLSRGGGASERDVADGLGNNAWKDAGLSQTYMPDSFDTASRAVAAIRAPQTPKKRNTG